MTDSQVGYSLLGIGVACVVIPLLLRSPPVRRACRRWLRRLGDWAVSQFEQIPERDPLAEEMFNAFRRERLRADIQRLERLLATDTSMSATRQLGNRLAYEWLLRELRDLRASAPAYAEVAWDKPTAWTAPRTAEVTAGRDWGHAPTVEVLEIGWKR
ncbi:MAG TPA: hypothetical protein VEQ66_01335 [Propionibacteriaceae bacterium]|nr:hypothetical protein [Propionibacteriaceae bacterium]